MYQGPSIKSTIRQPGPQKTALERHLSIFQFLERHLSIFQFSVFSFHYVSLPGLKELGVCKKSNVGKSTAKRNFCRRNRLQ